MISRLAHRGPDDQGHWIDQDRGVALGHRRLSVIDLSKEGSQPMLSSSGRYVIVYNGEIYNFKILREQLKQAGYGFRGSSDTEVLLAAIEEWGVVKALQRFNGMFTFALWDTELKELTLARDRIGIKPLYYGWQKDTFLFASELKALSVHPDCEREVERNAVGLLARHCYIPAPYSIYQGIYKLMPGCVLRLNLSQLSKTRTEFSPYRDSSTFSPESYWSLSDIFGQQSRNLQKFSDAEALERLEATISEAVSLRLVADVPLGAFLSGGIDSSLVVALMQAQSTRPVKTFTIGFNEPEYNEAVYAKAVAQHLGTDHTEFYMSTDECLEVIPFLPDMYDEPFADSSQIPTYLVSRLAREQVTVSLSGDGGDEFFCGYNRYYQATKIWKMLRLFPSQLRRLAGGSLRVLSPAVWDVVFNAFDPVLPRVFKTNDRGFKLHKLSRSMSFKDSRHYYRELVSHWKEYDQVALGVSGISTLFEDRRSYPPVHSLFEQLMIVDMLTYLPDDILVKVDRASMFVSLEARVPLLDHNVSELSASLPLRLKTRQGVSKWALRQLLYKYVPAGLIERPKMGFGLPFGLWLRGGLRDWAENLLDARKLKEQGFFDVEMVQTKWREHLSGTYNWKYLLWDILMFQAWLENQR